MELAGKLAGGSVKTIEELAEVRGALRMLRTMQSLPAHVQNKLDDFRTEETQRKEREKHVRRQLVRS